VLLLATVFFLVGFFVACAAVMLEVLAIGAEVAAVLVGTAAKAPRLNAEATTAAMRVFMMEILRGVSDRADCSASQRGVRDDG
jgi:hypothetical protein